VALAIWIPQRFGASAAAGVGAATTAGDSIQAAKSSAEIGKALRDAQLQLLGAVAGKSALLPSEIADRLEVVFDGLQQSAERIPRTTFDPQAIVDAVGPEPAKLLDWVKNETRLVPYQGVLRGPVGVLLDRFGNSLDRAMLLAELLRLAGHEVTLGRTTLTKEKAAALLATARTPRASTTSSADPTQAVVDEFFEAYAQKFGGDAQALKRGTAAVRAVADAAGRSAIQRVAAQTAALLDVVKGKISTTGNDNDELAALGDHWFVRRRTDDGWVDLDPSGIARASGTPAQAVEGTSPDDVPAELRHTVSMRVIIECACGGRLEEREVLRHDMRMTEAIGVPIAVQQLPELPGGWTPLAETDPLRAFGTKLETATGWQAVLVVGSQAVAHQKFTMAGEVLAPGEASKSRNGGVVDAFGGGGEAPGQLTAEFIEYEIHAPGQPDRTLRRTLFDWIGASRRATFSGGREAAVSRPARGRVIEASVSTDILLLGEQPSNAFAMKQAADALLAIRGYVLDQLRSAGKPALPDGRTVEFPSALYALAQNRAAWSERANRVAIAEPNILTRHYGYRADAAQPLTDWSAFDIVSNRVQALDATHMSRVESRLAQGVLDTNVEAILAAGRGTPTNIAEVMVTGTAKSWEVAAIPGQNSLVSVKPGSIGSGGAPDAGWWRIDLATGDTLGMDARGWGGQAMVEYLRAARIPATMIAGVGCMWSGAGKSHPTARMAVCAAASLLTINGFLLGGLAGQAFPLIGSLLGIGGMFLL
jgi:transglutaminase-like putative cysteine protease